MRCSPMWSLLVLLAACEARISGAPGDPGLTDAATGGDDGDAQIDAPGDVGLGPWSAATKLLPVSSTATDEDDVTLSSNTLEMIFAIDDPAGNNGKDLYYSSRASTALPWSAAAKLPFNSPTLSDETPRLSADDKTLYFASGRAGKGNLDIYTVTRPAAGSMAWSATPAALTSVNTTLNEKWYMPCGTHYILVQSTTNNGSDLLEGTIGNGSPTPITALNSPQNETGTFLSQDCLTIYFASTRPTATSPSMIYTSHRASLTDPWQPPSAVVDLKIAGGNGSQEDPWISTDGRTFVFASNAAGTKDLYISTR